MSRGDPSPSNARGAALRASADDTFKRTVSAFGILLERITPWLLDIGSWIFGGLVAFNLLILGSLLTVGPIDRAVIVATAALALALPLDVAGFLMLRLVKDVKEVGLEGIATQAFREVGFAPGEQGRVPGATPSVETRGDQAPRQVASGVRFVWRGLRDDRKRRTGIILRTSYSLLALSALLTLVSVTAALWHMAWWIGSLFVAMVVISQLAVWGAIAASTSDPNLQPATVAEGPGKESGTP